MTAIQEERVLTELAKELYSYVPERYLAAFQQLLSAAWARGQFECGNTTRAFKLLMDAVRVKLNPKVCGSTSKEFVVAQVMGALPTMYQNDLNPD